MKTAIITSTKVKPRLRHMSGIYDLAAKSQCATQTCSVGVLERRKSDRRVLRRASPYQEIDSQAYGRARLRRADLAPPLRPSVIPFPVPATSWWNTGTHACLAPRLGSL